MKFKEQSDRDAETLSDLALTTEAGDEVKAGDGVGSAQLTIQGQISESGSGGGAGKCQVQDFQFVHKTG